MEKTILNLLLAALNGEADAVGVLADAIKEAGHEDAGNKVVGVFDPDPRGRLAAEHRIAIIWDCEDVRSVRPDLTEEQAWEVLREVDDSHDSDYGITWEILESVARTLHGREAKLWVRVGDQDDYHEFEACDMYQVEEYLSSIGIKSVQRDSEFGLSAEHFTGQNYISLYWASDVDSPIRGLEDREIEMLNAALASTGE